MNGFVESFLGARKIDERDTVISFSRYGEEVRLSGVTFFLLMFVPKQRSPYSAMSIIQLLIQEHTAQCGFTHVLLAQDGNAEI